MIVWKILGENPNDHSFRESRYTPQCGSAGLRRFDFSRFAFQQKLVVEPDLASMSVVPYYQKHFGQFSTHWNRVMCSAETVTGFTNIPLGEVLNDVDVTRVVKNRSSMQQFRAAQKAGRIVSNPILAYKGLFKDVVVYDTVGTPSRVPLAVDAPTPAFEQAFTCNNGRLPMGALSEFFQDGYGTSQGQPIWRSPRGPACMALIEVAKVEKPASFFDIHGQPSMEFASILPTMFPRNLRNQALDALHSGVYDVLTEIGEARETVTYLYDILRRLVLLFINVKSKEVRARKKFKGKELMDELASLWMQFRYAASPLAYSFEDALSLADLNRKFISVRKRIDTSFSVEADGYVYSGDLLNRCFAKAAVSNSKLDGLGLNPVKTLWELSPLSFVVDWVLPIGEFLGSLYAPPSQGETVVSQSWKVSNLAVTHTDGTVIPHTIDAYQLYNVPATATPFTFDVNMNWKRWADAAALSWSLFIKDTLR